MDGTTEAAVGEALPQDGDAGETELHGPTQATVTAVADQNGTEFAGNEAADALLHGPQPVSEQEALAALNRPQGVDLHDLLARLETVEHRLTDHAGEIETITGLVLHLGDKSGDLATKLETIAATVEQLAPLTDDERKAIADAITLGRDIAQLLPRLTAIEAKIKHWF